MRERELLRLSEGERERDPRVLYTTQELTFGGAHGATLADLVSPDAGTTFYEVSKHGDSDDSLPASPIAHNRYVCLRVQEANG